MFFEFVCLMFAIIDLTIGRPSTNPLFYGPFERGNTLSPPDQFPKTGVPLQNLLQHGLESDRDLVPEGRTRRGIVLVDEDFDVPQKPEWNDDVWNTTAESEETSDMEGSGSSNPTFGNSSTTNLTPEQLSLSSTKEMGTSEKEDRDLEGSGGYTTGTSTTSETPQVTTRVLVPKRCLNYTCDSKDLIISPRISRMIPEGANLTISCTANDTDKGSLKWYTNSNSSLLEESNKENELILDIPKAQLQHSGRYMCVRLTDQFCCHKDFEIIVYEVPNYKSHLIVIGLVAAASLFICIMLVITRSHKTKKYKEQLEMQNFEKPMLT